MKNLKSKITAASLLVGVSVLGLMGAQAQETSQAQIATKATQNITAPQTVIELFTSQGCSSCPPANEFIQEIAKNEDVLALSFSVDYWDYLGWKDTNGKSLFSARQRDYGAQFQGQVYTPQMVINGNSHASRLAKSQVLTQKLRGTRPQISIAEDQGQLTIAIPARKAKMLVSAVTYKAGVHSTPVKAGENRGRNITLVNTVIDAQDLGATTPRQAFSYAVSKPSAGHGLAVLVQEYKGGPIVSALNLTP